MNTTSVVELDHKLIFQTYILMCMCKYGMDFEDFFSFVRSLRICKYKYFNKVPPTYTRGYNSQANVCYGFREGV